MSNYTVLPLDAVEATLALVGGKGANLAKLARAGFPVPGGFLVTTQGYNAFVTSNQLGDWLQEQLATVQADDPSALTTVSEAIRARFVAGILPSELAIAITAAYRALGQPLVAVRSSATAEDLPELSFAGQQETYLNILGEDALLQAVISCWGSLWTARAIGYRARNNIAHSDVALAVVVQHMVQSEASGVLFTANPLTGKRGETVIDATLGLGEALVSGQVEPDHYVVEMNTGTKSGRILSRTLGAKALTIRGRAGGGTVTVNEDSAKKQALPDPVILELAQLGQRVAQLYGTPQDIEWGWVAGKLHLLQARPITSLYPLPAGLTAEPLEILFSFGAIQGMLDPMTPLGRDTFSGVIAGGGRLFGFDTSIERQSVLLSAGQRLWLRGTPMLRNRLGRTLMRNALKVIEPSIGQAVTQLLDEPGLQGGGYPQPRTLRNLARAVLPIAGRLVTTLLWPEQNRQQVQALMEGAVQKTEWAVAQCKTLAERLTLYEQTLYSIAPVRMPQLIPRLAAGLFSMNRLLALAQQAWSPAEYSQRALALTRGLPHNVTTEMDLLLWQTARSIQQDATAATCMANGEAAKLSQEYLAGKLPKVAQQALTTFLTRYGMRGVAEIDFGRPRWRDNPAQVMQMVQSYLRIGDPSQAPDVVFARGAQVAEQTLADLVSTLRSQPGGALRAWFAGWYWQRMRALAGLRETPKFTIVRIMGTLRQSLLISGAELAQQGILAQPEDIFFLHLGELKGLAAGYAIDWRALVAERRANYDREKLRRQIPRVLLSDGRAFYEGVRSTTGERAGVLTGSPVSPGVVEGTVRVVFDPHHTQLAHGEILVCPGTDPAWTPLFLAAGGLVMEVGGLMTHGSVVAREYGIPAVVGVHEATTRLHTGQRVRVDGSSGEVVLL